MLLVVRQIAKIAETNALIKSATVIFEGFNFGSLIISIHVIFTIVDADKLSHRRLARLAQKVLRFGVYAELIRLYPDISLPFRLPIGRGDVFRLKFSHTTACLREGRIESL
jgi:hypothetical protein